MVGKTGAVYAFGAVKNYGSSPTADVSHLSRRRRVRGYWIVNTAGHVFAHGDAKSYGSASGLLARRARSRASRRATRATATGCSPIAGRVIACGDAKFYGDAHAKHSERSDRGFGRDVRWQGLLPRRFRRRHFHVWRRGVPGSMGNRRLNKPVNGLVPTKDGRGYWLVASDGGIFAFNAPLPRLDGWQAPQPADHRHGPLRQRLPDGWFRRRHLQLLEPPFLGSLGGKPPAAPIVGVATGS